MNIEQRGHDPGASVPTYEELLARVTELERQQQQASAERERLLAVINSLPDDVFFVDAGGNVVLVNDAARQSLGLSDKEDLHTRLVNAEAMFEVLKSDGTPRRPEESPFVPALRGEIVRGEEIVRNLKSGERRRRQYHVAPVFVGKEVAGAVSLVRDVSDRLEAEEALRESEKKFRELFEHLLDGYAYCHMLFDEAGRPADFVYLAVNAAFTRLTGLENVVGKRVTEAIPGIREAEPEVLEIYGRVASTGRPERFEIEFKPLNKWLTISVYSPRKGDFVAVFDDITARKVAEKASNEALQRLLEADRQKNEFISVLSHELRNPLAPIKNSLYVIDRAGGLNERGRRAAEVIGRQVSHLTRLIEDLLDVTRISKGKIRLQETRADLRDLVSRTVEDLRSVLEGHQLSMALPEDRVGVYGDPTRLAQVIGNLLTNAVKFTPRGGRIDVRLFTRDGKALLEVEDSGFGIEPQMLGQLFTPFVQADRTLDRSRGGLGLGLALAKGLVELHGGEISAHSDGLGRGSRFTVELPLEKRADSIVSREALSRTKVASRRILLIEDNLDAAESLREALELDGHAVITAGSGAEGVAKARESRPEIVLCDIGLPGMDGYAVARALRQEPNGSAYYLIALTGYAQPEDVLLAQSAGFNAHLSKPPDLGALTRLLAEAPAAGAGSR